MPCDFPQYSNNSTETAAEEWGVFLYQCSRKCLRWPFTPPLAATCRRRLCRFFFFSKKTQRLMGKSGDTRPSTGHTRVEERRRINLEFPLYGREAAFGFSESMMWKIRQICFQFSSLNTHQFVGLALACHLQKRRTELFIRREKLLLRRKREKKKNFQVTKFYYE